MLRPSRLLPVTSPYFIDTKRCDVPWEAVLSYMELLIALIRHTEHISLGRHCLVERRIEYYYLRSCFGDNLSCRLSAQVRVRGYVREQGLQDRLSDLITSSVTIVVFVNTSAPCTIL